MGFYVQDDFWEAVEDQPTGVRNAVIGALAELYFTGECSQRLTGTAKAVYTAVRDRVLLARKRSAAGSSKPDQNGHQKPIKTGSKRVSKADQNGIKTGIKTGSKRVSKPDQNRSRLLKSESEKEKEKEREKKKKTQEAAAVLAYLNERAGRSYKTDPPSEYALSKIGARLDDGFTVDDCKRVIDNKCASWLGDERMDRFLRPETLFAASKFEAYLNEGGGKEGGDADVDELAARMGF